MSDLAPALEEKIRTGQARVGTSASATSGLPLSVEFASAGLRVTGFDLSPEKVAAVNRGESYIKDVPVRARGGAGRGGPAARQHATSTSWPSATR